MAKCYRSENEEAEDEVELKDGDDDKLFSNFADVAVTSQLLPLTEAKTLLVATKDCIVQSAVIVDELSCAVLRKRLFN